LLKALDLNFVYISTIPEVNKRKNNGEK